MPSSSETVIPSPYIGSSPSRWLPTLVSRYPTDTMPMTWPPERMGALPRADTPSVPRWTPTQVFPASTVAGLSSMGLPIRAASGWENRIPCRFATTM